MNRAVIILLLLLALPLLAQDEAPALPDTNAINTAAIKSNLPPSVLAIIASNLANLPTNVAPHCRVISFYATNYPTALMATMDYRNGGNWHVLATFQPTTNQISYTDYCTLPRRFYTVAILPVAPQLTIRTN